MTQTDSLFAISPLDGRYQSKLNKLSTYFSEYSLIKHRLLVEVSYLIHVSRHCLQIDIKQDLMDLVENFNENEARHIKEIETVTKHDVKSIEYYLREKISDDHLKPFIHFGLTSEDINNIAYSLMLQECLDQVYIPELQKLMDVLINMAEKYKTSAMVAKTHGQVAVPTTMGKEIFVFVWRLHQEMENLKTIPIEAKLNGAVGNYNALVATYPDIDWTAVGTEFITSLGLKPNLYTTQILPGDSYVRIFQSIHLINSILIGLMQDFWRYISDGVYIQKIIDNEVGSSTMPQKVNPIDFENAEGNLGLANALFDYFGSKLPVSRLQRDLSDSTIKRNIGVALGHSFLAYKSCIAGLNKISFDSKRAVDELESHWEVVTEGIQTILRSTGDSNAYEKLKFLSRGKRLTQETITKYINSLDISIDVKQKLHALTPQTYSGLADKLVIEGLKTIKTKGKTQ